jgi:chitodextrinase
MESSVAQSMQDAAGTGTRAVRRRTRAMAAFLASAVSATATAASLEFFVNGQQDYDYGENVVLPAAFGSGEFTLEIWLRLNDSFPVGSTAVGTAGQRQNWSNADNVPYSSDSWWFAGNFLLDGHNNNDFSAGTFSLQFYGGGRVRWLFGDGGNPPGSGGTWSVGAYPASSTAHLLDGNWHQVTLVRRWIGTGSDAQLELWIDGATVAMQVSDVRTNMRQWWDNWAGFPTNQDGWFWGAEKQAAIGSLNQYEDYKGLVDELRFWSRAKTSQEIQASFAAPVTGAEPGLVGWYDLDETAGLSSCSNLVTTQCIALTETSARLDPAMWSVQNAPLLGGNDTQAPSVPFNLQGTPISTTRIDLSWNASNDNVAVAGYRVRRNGTLVGTVSGTGFSDTGLSAATTYNYTVSAFDAAGNESAQSPIVPVATLAVPDSQAPSVPGGLQGAAASSSRIDLNWNASADNVAVAGYRIRRNGTAVGTTAGTTFSDTGLSASTSYAYTVAAFDAAGNESAPSGAVNVTTLAAPPPPPGGGGGGGGGSAGYLELLLLLLLGLGGSLRRP